MANGFCAGKMKLVCAGKGNYSREGLVLLLGACPFILFIFAFSYVPIFGWVYAFFDCKPGVPLTNSAFIGLELFKIMFSSGNDELARVLRNTLAMYFLKLLASPVPVMLAVFVNEIRTRPFKAFFQTVATFPNFVSFMILYSVFFSFFSSQGVANQIFLDSGLLKEPLDILGNNDLVWFYQTLISVWKTAGWNSIIYLAVIAGIDTGMYDAARIDGAGRFSCMLYITLPGLIPAYLVLLILSISNMLSGGFEQYLLFWNAKVADRIEVLDYYMYKLGLGNSDYSYATAIGMLKTFISVGLLFFSNKMLGKIRGTPII